MPAHDPRPGLHPGLRVSRRDGRHLQVGVDAPHHLVVDDEPDVRRVLADLSAGRRPRPLTAAGTRCLTDLVAAGLVLEESDLRAREARRRAARVAVDADPGARAAVSSLLVASGCGVSRAGAPATLVVVLGAPEIARDRLDPLVREGVPHLVVSGGVAVVVGPFVVPGVTACVRCLDAHLAEHDPRRAVVVEQVATQSHDAPSWDPATLALVSAWAARDALAYVDGQVPSTWSATVTFASIAAPAVDLVPVHRRWSRHPHCGCTWGDALAG